MKDEEMAEEYADRTRIVDENTRVGTDCISLVQDYEGNVIDIHERIKQAFLAGLKAGRPQWHYVKDGDYPDTDRTVLAYSDDVVSGHYPYFAQYYKGFTNTKENGVDLNWNCWRNNMQRELVEPTVWCELPTFDKE